MRKLIIVCIILLTPFILQAQEYSGEYKVVCKRVSGCPVVNGTCPTCTIVGGIPKTITNEEIAEWGNVCRNVISMSPWKMIPRMENHQGGNGRVLPGEG